MEPIEDTTVAGALSPKQRRITYAVLRFAVPVVALVVALTSDGLQVDDVPVLLAGAVSAGGFHLAKTNTPTD